MNKDTGISTNPKEIQKPLIETEHQKRLSEKEAVYLKAITELKAYQEAEKLKDELVKKLEGE